MELLNVVLDTSVLCGDYFLRSPDARVLIDALAKSVECIYIPEVVKLEAINKNREELEAAEHQHRKYVRELARLSRPDGLPKAPDPRELSHTFFTFIHGFLKEPRILSLPFPEIGHQEVVLRELTRKKPFDPRGTGYRDYLIWRSVVELARAEVGEVAFISRNTKDFASDGRLHPDLRADLEEKHIVTFYPDLREFVAARVIPRLMPNERLKAELARGTLKGFSLRKWFEDRVADFLLPEDAHCLGAGTSEIGFHCSFREPHEILALEPVEVRTLNSEASLVRARAELRVRYHVYSEPQELNIPEVKAYWWKLGKFEPEYGDVHANHETVVKAMFSLVLGKDTNQVLSAELSALAGERQTQRFSPPVQIE